MFYSTIAIIGCNEKILLFIGVADPDGVDPDPKLDPAVKKNRLEVTLEKQPGFGPNKIHSWLFFSRYKSQDNWYIIGIDQGRMADPVGVVLGPDMTSK